MIPKLNVDFTVSRLAQSFVPWIRSSVYPSRIGNVFFTNHARTGLRLALSALNLPDGSKIGMSMYNCLTVMNAIRVAGYEIVFLDITDDLLLDLENLKEKSDGLSAIIVSHFYGIPNDIDAIKAVLPNIPIIEDCAHAYGSLFEDGTSVGTKGDFAVFSTGLGKFPSIGDGGLLTVNNADYLCRVNEIFTSLPEFCFMEEVKMIIKGFIKFIAYRPMVYKMLLPLKRWCKGKGCFEEMYQHREAVMPKYVHYLYDKEVPRINGMVRKQQSVSSRLASRIMSIDGAKIPESHYGKRNGFLFPVIVQDKSVIFKDSFLSRFELTSHFDKSIIWAKAFGYKEDCPNAEKIASHIIVLACNYRIKDSLL